MPQGLHHVNQEIVGHGSRWDNTLLGQGDGTGFRCSNPDGDMPLPLDFAKEDQGLVGRQFYPDADNFNFDHQVSIREIRSWTSALCSVRHSSLISRAASAARAWEAASRLDVRGATALSTRPNSRSAAAWNGRRWRGSKPCPSNWTQARATWRACSSNLPPTWLISPKLRSDSSKGTLAPDSARSCSSVRARA